MSEPSIVAVAELATHKCFAWARLIVGQRPIADLNNLVELDFVRRIATMAAACIAVVKSGRTVAGRAEG